MLSADLLYILKRNARAQTSVRLLSEMPISGNLTVSWIMLGRGPSWEAKALAIPAERFANEHINQFTCLLGTTFISSSSASTHRSRAQRAAFSRHPSFSVKQGLHIRYYPVLLSEILCHGSHPQRSCGCARGPARWSLPGFLHRAACLPEALHSFPVRWLCCYQRWQQPL